MSEQETETEETEEIEESEGVEGEIESRLEEVEETVEEQREKVEERLEEVEETVEETVEEQRDRVEETLEEGLDAVDDAVVDVISAVLDSGAGADVYVALRKLGEADIDELAEETGLYPKKVEETVEGLVEEEIVEEAEVGDDTVYTAISPTDFVVNVPRRLADRVRGVVEVEDDGEDDDGRRVFSADWAPYRLIIEPNETEEVEGEEIPVQT